MSAIFPTNTNYANRQVDVELLQTVTQPANLVPVTVSTVRTAPKMVTGIEKLVQRYTLLLLTHTGTVHFDQAQGGDLLTLVFGGYVQDAGQLNYAFASANSIVVAALYAEDINTDVYGVVPDDEQISSATLLDAQVDRNTATAYLRIRINSKAGTSFEFVVPVTKK